MARHGGLARVFAMFSEMALHWLSQHQYAALFALLALGVFALPLPDETLLTFTGYMVYKGHMEFLPAAGVAFAGACCGISLSYMVGRLAGRGLRGKLGRILHITPHRLDLVHRWFERIGRWVLTFGFFIPVLRHLTAMVAGTSRLELPAFAAHAYGGALVWTVTFVTLGYFLGEQWSHLPRAVHTAILAIGAGLGTGVAGRMLWYWFRAGRKTAAGH